MRVIGKYLLLALVGVAGMVHADEAGEAALGYRQALFKTIRWNFIPMSEMARGKRPFDVVEARKRALAVSYLSVLLSEAFPAGSGSSAGTTDALDELWKQPEDFAAKLKSFQVEANALRSVAEQGDEARFAAQFKKLGASCKACHDKYKAD